MSEYEILDTMAAIIAMLDVTLEFWLTATFAVVVAAHFAGDRFTRSMSATITFLYLAATFLMMLRSVSGMLDWSNYADRLAALQAADGTAPPESALQAAVSLGMGSVRVALFLAGTAAAIYFINHTRRSQDPAKATATPDTETEETA